MKNLSIVLFVLGLGFFQACSSDSTTTWTISNVELIGTDECDFHDETDPLSGTFEIDIANNVVTMSHTELTIEANTEDFMEQDNEVTLLGSTTNTDFPPCSVGLAEEFTVIVDDSNLRLENNDSLSVLWNHTETEESTSGTCVDEWFVSLPCTTQLSFALTKVE